MRACVTGLAVLMTFGAAVHAADEPAPRTAPASRPSPAVPGPDEKVLFTFAIFGDNKGGSSILETTFRNMKRIRASFVIGMGDHFQAPAQIESWNASIKKVFGDTESFYERFYLTAGDNEAQAYSGKQSNAGSERPFFYMANMFDSETDKPLRSTIVDYDRTWLDYHAQLHVGGVRLHLVNLYDQDNVNMHKETVAFADRVLPRIRKQYPTDPVIVMAHDGPWWRKSFKPRHSLYSCDLLLGASWHRYLCFGSESGGTNMAFNTSSVARGGKSWYAVMAMKDKFVILNISDRAFGVRGKPGCHIKPFGKKGYSGRPGPWFELLKAYGRGGKGPWGPLPAGPKDKGVTK